MSAIFDDADFIAQAQLDRLVFPFERTVDCDGFVKHIWIGVYQSGAVAWHCHYQIGEDRVRLHDWLTEDRPNDVAIELFLINVQIKLIKAMARHNSLESIDDMRRWYNSVKDQMIKLYSDASEP